eukprot:gene218-945_t
MSFPFDQEDDVDEEFMCPICYDDHLENTSQHVITWCQCKKKMHLLFAMEMKTELCPLCRCELFSFLGPVGLLEHRMPPAIVHAEQQNRQRQFARLERERLQRERQRELNEKFEEARRWIEAEHARCKWDKSWELFQHRVFKDYTPPKSYPGHVFLLSKPTSASSPGPNENGMGTWAKFEPIEVEEPFEAEESPAMRQVEEKRHEYWEQQCKTKEVNVLGEAPISVPRKTKTDSLFQQGTNRRQRKTHPVKAPIDGPFLTAAGHVVSVPPKNDTNLWEQFSVQIPRRPPVQSPRRPPHEQARHRRERKPREKN